MRWPRGWRTQHERVGGRKAHLALAIGILRSDTIGVEREKVP